MGWRSSSTYTSIAVKRSPTPEILARVAEIDDVIEASLRAFNDEDWDALERLWEPDGVMVGPPAWPESGDIIGWPAIRAQFQRLKADWREDHISIEEIEKPAPGTVLVRMRWTVTGAASELPFDVPMWMVAQIRAGKYFRADYFQEESPAREAAGVPAR
jgi:hypothetical protein